MLTAGAGADQAQGRQSRNHHSKPHHERAADWLVQGRLRVESHEGDLDRRSISQRPGVLVYSRNLADYRVTRKHICENGEEYRAESRAIKVCAIYTPSF